MGALVLVVDDDTDIRETIGSVLEDAGYAVATAANGEEALRYLRSHDAPKLILLDLMMPVMDGIEFRTRQRQDPALARIPVVVISADADHAAAYAARHLADFLVKPFKLAALLEIVSRHCVATPSETQVP